MSTFRPDYLTAIDSFVRGEIPLGEADKDLALSLALKRYSKDKPYEVVADIAGTGGFDYAVSLLTSWASGFSVIHSVEYPVDDTDETPDTLDDAQWMVYAKPSGKVLRFLDEKPAATETFRVAYTALHVCSSSQCTVDTCDEQAVQALAAAMYCDMIAAYYAQMTDGTLDADGVDQQGQATEYRAQGNKYRRLYFAHMGIKEGSPKAASYTADQDVDYPGGTDRLTHPRRYR